jgi:hypothetical protein
LIAALLPMRRTRPAASRRSRTLSVKERQMSEPTAKQRIPIITFIPDGQRQLAALGRVTGAAGLVTLLAVVGTWSTPIRTSR